MIGGGTATTPAQRQTAGAYWLNTIDPDYTSASMAPTDPLLALPNGPSNRQAVTVNPSDYTLSAIFGNSYFNLSGWMPSLIPRIATQPTSQSVSAGVAVTFSVVATGTPVATYQWYKGNVAISGATAASYTINSSLPTDTGSYTVVVTNAAGSVHRQQGRSEGEGQKQVQHGEERLT